MRWGQWSKSQDWGGRAGEEKGRGGVKSRDKMDCCMVWTQGDDRGERLGGAGENWEGAGIMGLGLGEEWQRRWEPGLQWESDLERVGLRSFSRWKSACGRRVFVSHFLSIVKQIIDSSKRVFSVT